MDSRPQNVFIWNQAALGVARAMINNPQILFLDEPTNGVESANHDLHLALNKEKAVTIILSTHILGDVERLKGGHQKIVNGFVDQINNVDSDWSQVTITGPTS